MPLYLTPIVGSGLTADPFRPIGFDQPGVGWIDLRPDATISTGRGLLYLPTDVADPRILKFADVPAETLSLQTLTRLQNALSLSVSAKRADAIMLELLTVHARTDGSRWRPLRPTVDGQLEIWLGGLRRIAESSLILHAGVPGWWIAGVGFLPFRAKLSRRALVKWLVAMPIVGMLLGWPSRASATTITENWNCADSASLTCNLPWTEIAGTDWGITSNRARHASSAGAQEVARADSDLATDNHEVQATLATWAGAANQNAHVGLIARKNSVDATLTYYLWIAEESPPLTQQWELLKRVTGTFTGLGINSQDPLSADVMRLRCDGSTIRGLVNGISLISVTDTSITGNVRGGVTGFGQNGSIYELDAWSASDLAGAGQGPAGIAPLRSILGVGI